MNLFCKDIFELIFPLLFFTYVFFRIAYFIRILELKKRIIKPSIILFSAFITFFPFNHLSLAEYFLSLNPNNSIGSIALLFSLIWGELKNKRLLSEKEIVWFSLWNIFISLCLFSSSLGIVDMDIYPLGYGFSIIFVIVALLTVLLIYFRNKLSYIFLFYIIAFNLKLLHSNNFFDYITDGFLFLISLGILFIFLSDL